MVGCSPVATTALVAVGWALVGWGLRPPVRVAWSHRSLWHHWPRLLASVSSIGRDGRASVSVVALGLRLRAVGRSARGRALIATTVAVGWAALRPKAIGVPGGSRRLADLLDVGEAAKASSSFASNTVMDALVGRLATNVESSAAQKALGSAESFATSEDIAEDALGASVAKSWNISAKAAN